MANTGLKEALRNAWMVFNKSIIGRKIIKEEKNVKITKIGPLEKIIEENVKIKLVLPIIMKLDWMSMSGCMEDVEFEYSCPKMGKRRVDCCLIEKDSEEKEFKFFIELKAYTENNTEIDGVDDLIDYCNKGDACYGVLTDGINWELYGPFANKNNLDNIEYNFDYPIKYGELFDPKTIGCQFCFCQCRIKNISPMIDVKQIYEDTIRELDVDMNKIDNIKEFIVSFLQKLGWEVEENKEKNKTYLVIKYKDTSVVVMIKPVLGTGNGWGKKDKDSLKELCVKRKVCYGVLTNGKRWFFCNYHWFFKSVVLSGDEKNIDKVADFLSMFSKRQIKNLHNKVTGTRVLDCILEINSELKEEVLEAQKNYEKMEELAKEELAKKLCDKLQEVKPDIAVDVLVEYLKSYIHWYGTGNTAKQEGQGPLRVKFLDDGTEKCRQSAHDTVADVIEKIGVEKVFKLNIMHGREIRYPIVNDKSYVYDNFNESRYASGKTTYTVRNIGKYFAMYHGDPKTLAKIILKINEKLECPLNLHIEAESNNEKIVWTTKGRDIIEERTTRKKM